MTQFLLHKPWYAGTKHNTAADTDADVDSSFAGADPERISTSASKADEEQDDEGFWVPQATPDGKLFYYNTLTGVSRLALPTERSKLTEPSSDLETKAMDSSQLPYADREDRVDSAAILRELARISGDENGDIVTTLAKFEGQYPKSQVGSSKEQDGTKQSLERKWQAIEAKSERNKVAALYSGRTINSHNSDVGAEARVEAKRDRWQRFRSITKLFGR